MPTTKTVRMRTAVRVPALVIGADDDLRLSKGDVEALPVAYANQLITDLFAEEPDDEENDDAVDEEDEGEDLSVMTKDQLLAEAALRGVTVKPADTKAEILAALTAR